MTVVSMTKLETPRLRFRELTTDDYDAVASVLLDKETAKAMEIMTDESFVRAWLERTIQRYAEVGYSHWYVELKETGDFVGIIGIVPEKVEGQTYTGLGYLVKREYQRQGIAFEGARACVEWAISELHAEQVVAEIAENNAPSIRLAEKLGMNCAKTYLRQPDTAYRLYQICRENG